MAQSMRYQLSEQKEDLDKSILHRTEAILLPLASQDGLFSNIVQLLFGLAKALLCRFEEFKQSDDIKYSIEYLRYLRRLPLHSFDLSRNTVTTSLIWALGVRVNLETGDGTQDVNEMVDLCREFLGSNISADFPVVAFVSLGGAVVDEYDRGQSIPSLDKVIECLRDAARLCPPPSHFVLGTLASTLFIRFRETHSNEDYEEATALLDKIIDPNQPGECPDSVRDQVLHIASSLAYSRSTIFQNPEYSEVTISRIRTLLNSSSLDGPSRLLFTGILARQIRERFAHYSLAESLEEANSYSSQIVDLSTSQNMENSREDFYESNAVQDFLQELYPVERTTKQIQHIEELLSITPPGTRHHKRLLNIFGEWCKSKYHHTNDISDIEESIKYSRLLLDATHPRDKSRIIPLRSLGNFLFLAFEKTRKTSYLDESITIGYEILELRSAQFIHFQVIWELVRDLLIRKELFGRREDLLEVIRLMSMGVDNQYAREPDRFRLSCLWAGLARSISHSTTLTAYKTAMSLVEKSLSFAPTVSIQHARLVEMGENCQTMPLDYASFQIKLGRFDEAVETLEQGRALLWSEMRGLRTPVVQLIEEDSPLAKRFAEINQELEAVTISVTPSAMLETEEGVAQSGDGMDPFGRLVIRGRPGLEGFLKAPSFTTLRSAASRGPVIIINHCKWRSDILIISHNSLPCSIPTINDFYTRANKLRDELVEARKHGLDSDEYQDALCSVLKGLYELVGEPVIKRLRLLGVPEQSRIWWCPTSVFCSLPLHAMGPIPSSDSSKKRYFSDLYIPSYTPSLSALIESRKTSLKIPGKPSLLLVAQPDHSLPGVKGEIRVIRSLEPRVTVAGLVSSEATPSSVVEGLQSSQFAHFACHGLLETGKPFDASFKLHGGSRLTAAGHCTVSTS
ncbi:hypothetical protein H4582DRAFT_2071663 [Lactarius indigo]|nr:hypothetical protein H4582DRAFT_2071663 [Lactarius indigo]